jgi:hypothetical protein
MNNSQTRTIGKNIVLPNLPYSPNMHKFDQMNITTESLAGHNAANQSFLETGPRPAPTIITPPRIQVPPMSQKSIQDYAMASSPGHSLAAENYMAARPTHPLEIYGAGPSYDVSHIQINGAETYAAPFIQTSVRESFGGNPRFEAEHMGYRPKNPTVFAPKIQLSAPKVSIPIREKVITPKANRPKMHDFAKMIKPSVGPTNLVAKEIMPPVRNSDIGGLLNSTSLVGGFANSNGRTIGNSSL